MASRIDYLQNRKLYVGTAPEVTVANGNAIIAGNVGIGTTSPDGKLDVAQNMTAGTTTAFTNPHLSLTALNATDNTGFVGMTFATSDNVNYGWSWGALRTNGGLGDMVLRNHYNSAQGTEKMRIDSNGNVGIGTDSPIDKLNVDGGTGDTSTQDSKLALTRTSSTGNVLAGKMVLKHKATNFGNLVFQVKTTASSAENSAYYTDAITIDGQNAKVGIGTTSPDKDLTVGGINPTHGINLRTKSGSSEWLLWQVEQYFSQEGYMRMFNDNVAKIQFRAGGDSYFVGGNVGIGVTGPGSKLEVTGDVTKTVSISQTRTTTSTSLATMRSFYSFGITQFRGGVDKGLYMSNVTDNLPGIQVVDSSDAAGPLSIQPYGGNVGIGTTAPTGSLTVESAGNQFHIRANTATAGEYWNFDVTSANQLYIINNAGTGYLTIKNDGNVGIGLTNPTDKLVVAGNISIPGAHKIYNGSAADSAGLTFPSNVFRIDGFSGITFNSSTTNIGSQTERMRITNDGNVGIGTTNPLSQLSIGSNAITTKKPTVIIADGVAGGSLVIRGLSPILSFDRTGASPENKILMDGVGLEFKTGSLDAEGDVDFKIKLDGKLQAPAYTQGFLQSDANGNIEISGGGTLPGGPYLPLSAGSGYPLTGNLFINNGFTLSWGADTTKIAGNSSTNELSLITASTTRMRIDSAGNVGIGTTSPGYKLQVGDTGVGDGNIAMKANGSGADAGAKLTFNMDVGGGNSNSYIAQIVPISYDSLSSGTHNSLNFKVGTWNNNADAGVSRMTILSNGNVGIGTTDPESRRLSVVKDTGITAGFNDITEFLDTTLGGGGSVSLNIGKANSSKNLGKMAFKYVSSGSNSNALNFGFYDADNLMTLQAGGNVGIGTTSPGNKLSIAEDMGTTFSDAFLGLKATLAATANTKTAISLATSTVNNYGVTLNGIRQEATSGEPRFGINMHNNSSGGIEAFSIRATGNVGIGTTGPGVPLDVVGDIRTTTRYLISTGTANQNMAIGYWDGSNARIEAGSALPMLITSYQGNIKLGINGGTTMTVQSSNVGIGTTSPSGKLDVQGGEVMFSINTANKDTFLFTTGAADKGILNIKDDTTVKVKLNTNGDSYLNGGNVGIGTTSPEDKLHVSGGNVRIYSTNNANHLILKNNATATSGVFEERIKFLGWNNNENAAIIGIGNAYFGSPVNALAFQVSGVEAIRIKHGGNVGIGTASPGTLHGAGYGTTKLHVDGGTDRGQMIIEGDSFAGIVLSDNGATANQRVFATSVDDTKYTIKPLNDNGTSTAGGVAVTVLHNGNVGINNSIPNEKLSVRGNIELVGEGVGNCGVRYIKYNCPDEASYNVLGLTTSTANFITKVGINKTSPAVKLDVSDSIAGSGFTNGVVRFENSIEDSTGGAGVLNIQNNYQGGFGTLIKFWFEESSVASINFNSSTNAVVYNTTSDYRLKEDLQQFDGLEIVDQIKTYNYKWKKADARGYGALAHELQEVFPDAVTGDKDGEDMQGVDYSTLVPVLIKSIQELKAEIELLKQQINN